MHAVYYVRAWHPEQLCFRYGVGCPWIPTVGQRNV